MYMSPSSLCTTSKGTFGRTSDTRRPIRLVPLMTIGLYPSMHRATVTTLAQQWGRSGLTPPVNTKVLLPLATKHGGGLPFVGEGRAVRVVRRLRTAVAISTYTHGSLTLNGRDGADRSRNDRVRVLHPPPRSRIRAQFRTPRVPVGSSYGGCQTPARVSR